MNRAFKSSTRVPRASITRGEQAERRALAYLLEQGLALVSRNYRCKGGEIDLVMREPDGTLVFVEVRARRSGTFGGAAASITAGKRQRIVHAASHYLATLDDVPRCRLDVIAIDAGRLDWLRDAFGAGA